MKLEHPNLGKRHSLLGLALPSIVISCTLLATDTLDAQEMYTMPTSDRPAAIQQTVQEGGVGQDLGVSSSGRSTETLQPRAVSTAANPDGSTAESTESGESAGGATGEGGGEGLSFFDLAGGSRNPFRLSGSIREGYDDNTNTSKTNRVGSFFTNLAAGIRYDFGSPRLRMSTNLTGGATLYYTRPGRNLDISGIYTLSAVYAASARLTLSINSTVGWYPQPDVGILGTSVDQQDGSYFFTATTLGANYQWARRFSTSTSYSFRAIAYSDEELNANQGNMSQTVSQSFNFELWPTTTLVAEYRANVVTYFEADLDSFGNYALLGFNHVFNPRSRWNLRAGLEQRFNNNSVDGQSLYLGPFFESVATYSLTSRSELAWSARYGTEQSGLNNVTQRQTFRTGLSVSHAFTGRISGSAGMFYSVNYYDQPNVIPDYYQNVAQLNLGLRYTVNRFLSVSAGYQFTGVLARQEPDQEYYRNILFLGLNTNF